MKENKGPKERERKREWNFILAKENPCDSLEEKLGNVTYGGKTKSNHLKKRTITPPN